MNPRRVHALLRERFPQVPAVRLDWVNIADVSGVRLDALCTLLDRHVPGDALLVEVHRKQGDCLPRHEAVAYIARHVGQGRIRVTDRAFTGFVIVERNGVATGW